jgi:hypothetical protein
MRRLLGFVAITAFVAGAAACGGGGGDDDKAVAKSSRPESTTTTTTAPPPPPPVAPLTGVVDEGGASLTRPVLSVKIENAPEARPQSGLELADVVYEEVVEGGITRFLVMYNSIVPDVVGPVRSVRDMDPYIVWPLGGIFAYSGGAPGPDAAIREAPVNPVDESATGTAMFRGGGAAPHNLFGYGQAFFDRGGQPAPPPALFSYLQEGETVVGEPVLSARVGFQAGYDPTWTYDPGFNIWMRSYGAAPFMTASGAQVSAVNVIVQFIDYPGYSQGDTIGGGDAWVFSGGQLVRGKWLRGAREEITYFVDAAGTPIKLTPGRTWVELVPIGAAVDVVPAPAPPPPPPPPPTEASTTTTAAPEKQKNKNADE